MLHGFGFRLGYIWYIYMQFVVSTYNNWIMNVHLRK